MYKKIYSLLPFFLLFFTCTLSAQVKKKDSTAMKNYDGVMDYLDSAKNNNIAALLGKTYITRFELSELKVVKGNVYISTNGKAEAFSIEGTGVSEILKTIYYKCIPGSKVAYENCIFLNSDGTKTKPVSKLFIVGN